MRDETSRTEAEAARAADLIGRGEWIGGGAEVLVPTPYCSACQRGTSEYVCGPCRRDQAEAQEERIVREERDREWWTA